MAFVNVGTANRVPCQGIYWKTLQGRLIAMNYRTFLAKSSYVLLLQNYPSVPQINKTTYSQTKSFYERGTKPTSYATARCVFLAIGVIQLILQWCFYSQDSGPSVLYPHRGRSGHASSFITRRLPHWPNSCYQCFCLLAVRNLPSIAATPSLLCTYYHA